MTDYEVLFDTTPTGRLDSGWQSGTVTQRTKTTKAGDFAYVESFPVWDTTHKHQADEAREKHKTTAAQDKINKRRAQLRIEQLINNNFGPGDILLTCTYPDSAQPEDARRAHKDIQNYMTRIKRLREKRGLSPLKYVYVTEYTESEKRGLRFHHHCIINAGLSRDEVEQLWTSKHGSGICNTRTAQEQDEGLAGWANYITKQLHRSADPEEDRQKRATVRGWCRSRNLKVPVTTTADKKLSKRRMDRIVEDVAQNGRAILEKIYPGYHIIGDVTVYTSPFVPGAYIRAKLRKIKGGIRP